MSSRCVSLSGALAPDDDLPTRRGGERSEQILGEPFTCSPDLHPDDPVIRAGAKKESPLVLLGEDLGPIATVEVQ